MIGFDDLPNAIDNVTPSSVDRDVEQILERAKANGPVVARLTSLLERAKRGEILAIATAVLPVDGPWIAGWSSRSEVPFDRLYAAIGGLHSMAESENNPTIFGCSSMDDEDEDEGEGDADGSDEEG